MLVLSRNCDETIMIGEDVEITVLGVRGEKVRLGIRAPARIPVHRKEVYIAMQEENARAAESHTASLNEAMVLYKKRSDTAALTGMESRED